MLTCLSAHALRTGWESPTVVHVPLCPCDGAWMGGTHPCSGASMPMRWSVDGRHTPLLTCLSAHALERGWEAHTVAHVPLSPCATAWMGGTQPCSRAFFPTRLSMGGRRPPLLTCPSANAPECGWEAPTLPDVSLCPHVGAWMGGTHPCSRASLPMRWSVDGRHPPLLTCFYAHALERRLKAHTFAHVPLCPCDGVWMGVTHPCSRASLPMRCSLDGRHLSMLTCLSAHAV